MWGVRYVYPATHMQQSWNLLSFDAKRYDPIMEAPEE
jgi:hypothetical protein